MSILVVVLLVPLVIRLLERYPKQMIIASFAIIGLSALLLFVSAFLTGAYSSAIYPALIILIIGFVYYTVRKRLDFTALAMKTSASIMTKSWGVSFMNIVSLIFMLIAIAIGCLLSASIVVAYSDSPSSTPSKYGTPDHGGSDSDHRIILYVIAMFGCYWIVQYIRYQHYTTICGYMATWYYMHDSMPTLPVYNSFSRANTTSCGSVAFGSLVVTILSMIRAAFTENYNDRHQFGDAMGECCFSMLEQIAQYANSYCFCYISAYGRSYIASVKSFYKMCKHTKLGLLAQDVPISYVIGVMETFVTVISCLIPGFIVYLIYPSSFTDAFPYLFINLIVAYIASTLSLSSIEAGVKTFFVCFFEEPSVLRALNPILYQTILDTYGSSVIAPIEDA